MTHHFAEHYNHSRNTNPYFYFYPPSAALTTGATYFIPGFFSNGTIGYGGVANEASISSFLGTYFNPDGSVTYMPEQIPPQGWYRRGFPMFLDEGECPCFFIPAPLLPCSGAPVLLKIEHIHNNSLTRSRSGIDGIISLYTGAAEILLDPLLFGANLGTPNSFTGTYGLTDFSGTSTPTIQGVGCAIEGSTYALFISEFSSILNTATTVLNTAAAAFGTELGCPVPSGTVPAEADAPTGLAQYPSPSPCTLNKMQLGYDQCAPDTNTYGRFNNKSVPFCLNSPSPSGLASNPMPVPVPVE